MIRAAHGLRVVVIDERGRRLREPGLGRWLASLAPGKARGLASVVLVSGSRMRGLNRKYRRRDYATDVLSFPAGAEAPVPAPRKYLGDIVIALPVARRQARAAGHSEQVELRILALHGLLHLLGYDHERDNGAMERLERKLRRKGGL